MNCAFIIKSGRRVVLSKEFKGDYSHVKLCGNQVIMYDGRKTACIFMKKMELQKFKGRMVIIYWKCSRLAGGINILC